MARTAVSDITDEEMGRGGGGGGGSLASRQQKSKQTQQQESAAGVRNGNDDNNNNNNSSTHDEGDSNIHVQGTLGKVKNSTIGEKVSTATAVGAVGTSVAAMIMEGNPLIYVAGGLSSAIAPYSVYQQTKLTDIAALRETHEKLKDEVDKLSFQNQRLKATVTELSETVERLEDVEQALDLITNTQNQSVAAFAEQVKENKEVLAKMQKNLRANVLQNLLSVIIRSDRDGDFTINKDEIDNLIKRMKSINGVRIHEDRFRKAIARSGGNLNDVINVVKSLLQKDVPEGEEIFFIEESTDNDNTT